jgi:hypothetical protein
MSVFRVKLYILNAEDANLEYIGLVKGSEEDCFRDLRICLEAAGIVEWSFDFWDIEERSRIKKRAEAVSPIALSIYVIPELDSDTPVSKRHCTDPGTEEDDLPDCAVHDVEVHDDGNEGTGLQPPRGASRISDEEGEVSENRLLSTLIPPDVMAKYMDGVVKLKSELAALDMDDHLWHLLSSDHNGVGVIQLFCGDCNKRFGGVGGDHSKVAIHNLFANFKAKHLQTNLHIRAWCHRKGIWWEDHLQSLSTKSRPVKMTSADHRWAVKEGINILQSVNKVFDADKHPFVTIGDRNAMDMKSFMFKVQCRIRGEMM